jgi:hypothetical protein
MKIWTASSDAARAARARRAFRNRLALTTVLTVAPLMSYGRQAEAACVVDPVAPTYSCSGTSGAQSFLNIGSAALTTVAGFSVTAVGADNGITITGDGQLSYTDTNASPITSENGAGLVVRSTGNIEGDLPGEIDEAGGVVIDTNGNISGTYGIQASNAGAGKVSVTVGGTVTGRTEGGIVAENDSGSVGGIGLEITTRAGSVVTGEDDGIVALNKGGDGGLKITVDGRVTGLTDDGIVAENYGGADADGIGLSITTGVDSVITADENGIDADNNYGELNILVRGEVTSLDDDGIEATNDGTDLIITADTGSVITGDSDGIDAMQRGAGDLVIAVNGTVSGGDNGIEADHEGEGETYIYIGAQGVVQGDSAGIDVQSDGDQDIFIVNYGAIRNQSGNSSYVAIESWGGDTEIDNYGTITGVVRLGENDDHIDNYNVWNTAGGRNEFGLDTDRVHNFGVLVAANNADAAETTEFLDLEEFENDGGLLWLADGAVGDTLRIRGEVESEFENPLRYSAEGGYLAVDAVLGSGAAGESDILEIIGNVQEESFTTIAVNVVGASGVNTLGIPVVKVVDGNTGPDNFSLDRPVHGGLFAWDLRFDDEENWYELFTSGVGIGGYEMAAGLTGAQEIWNQTTGTLSQRQADLRPALNGTQVTPVADFAEPVAPTAAGRVGPGFWFNAVGGWLDRDAESDGYTLDRKQSIYGGLAGFDFATDGDGNGTWLFGLFGGYLSSTLKFSETNSKWTYDGPTIGAYATYLNDAFYADVTVKADFLSIEIEQEDLGADDSDTDGINLGGRIDAGYKIGGGTGAFVEPQATLAVVNTDIDDAEVGGGDVDFDSETSVKGRLGVKLGYDHTAANAMIFSSDLTASVWQEFNGSNDATISAAGLGDFGVSDDAIETLGDISLGFSVTATEGWTGFLRANYQFAEDFEAITGNAGLRYSW